MSNAPKFDPLLEPHEVLPAQPFLDGPQGAMPPRCGRWGEQYVLSAIPTKHILGAEGSYFITNNATVGTGVAHALVTSFTNTAALFVIKNNDQLTSAGGTGKRIFLDYMKLMLTAAPTAGVSLEFLFQLDTTSRTPTANNVAATPVNVNGSISSQGVSLIQAFNAGSLTVPAPSTNTSKNVGRVKMPVGVNIVGDEYLVGFGAVDHAGSSGPLTAIKAAQPARCTATAPPIVIGPQQFLVIYRWSLTEATAAPSYEWELAWFER